MSKSPDAFRTISEVADWLGVQAHVLRFWESKFTQIKPVKRAGGRRYYRPADMLLLGGIRKLLHQDGLSIKEVQAILRDLGINHVSQMSHSLDAVGPPEQSGQNADAAQPAEKTSADPASADEQPSGDNSNQDDGQASVQGNDQDSEPTGDRDSSQQPDPHPTQNTSPSVQADAPPAATPVEGLPLQEEFATPQTEHAEIDSPPAAAEPELTPADPPIPPASADLAAPQSAEDAQPSLLPDPIADPQPTTVQPSPAQPTDSSLTEAQTDTQAALVQDIATTGAASEDAALAGLDQAGQDQAGEPAAPPAATLSPDDTAPQQMFMELDQPSVPQATPELPQVGSEPDHSADTPALDTAADVPAPTPAPEIPLTEAQAPETLTADTPAADTLPLESPAIESPVADETGLTQEVAPAAEHLAAEAELLQAPEAAQSAEATDPDLASASPEPEDLPVHSIPSGPSGSDTAEETVSTSPTQDATLDATTDAAPEVVLEAAPEVALGTTNPAPLPADSPTAEPVAPQAADPIDPAFADSAETSMQTESEASHDAEPMPRVVEIADEDIQAQENLMPGILARLAQVHSLASAQQSEIARCTAELRSLISPR